MADAGGIADWLHETSPAGLARHDTKCWCLRAQGLQVVLYGDDFVESWRGTAGGKPSPACAGIPDVWQRHFGDVWRARAYGIAGAHDIATMSKYTSLTWCTLLPEPTEGPAAMLRRAKAGIAFH